MNSVIEISDLRRGYYLNARFDKWLDTVLLYGHRGHEVKSQDLGYAGKGNEPEPKRYA